MDSTDTSPAPHHGSREKALRQRAARVIPGGMYGHLDVSRHLPPGYPQFISRAEGARLWDSDGKPYIDYLCAFGPMIVGYQQADVLAAAQRQRQLADTVTGTTPVMVDLAECLTGQVRHADWAIFGKNGNDATTSCLMLSRAYTGRAKVLVAEGAYHGSQPWATPIPAGVIDSDRADLISYRFNDSESLATAVQKAGADLAGIVVSAFKHDAFADQELATPEFARLARSLCDGADAVLILDEVRAGFRISADATWSHWYDVQPDLSAWSKAIANGEPLSAVLGNDRLRDAAREVYVTGSFWCQAAPMAAALETQRLLAEQNAPARLEALGKRLRSGLEQHARRAGLTLRQTGPVQMPMVRFDDDAKLQQGFAFCAALLRRGILFHPWHNMFLSTAHTDADIDATLEAADAALAEVAAGR